MQSPLYADLVLLLEIAIGLVLLVGALLARKRKFREHAWCQSVAVLLNLVIVAVVMVPSFREQVSPKIPAKLGNSYVALATAHGALGGIVQLTALYILVAAGTKLLPERLRIQRYKLCMRTVLAAWWLVLLLGALLSTLRLLVRFECGARPRKEFCMRTSAIKRLSLVIPYR